MINWIQKIFFPSKIQRKQSTPDELVPEEGTEKVLNGDIQSIHAEMNKAFGKSADFKAGELKIGGKRGFAFYLDSMTDSKGINEIITKTLSDPTAKQYRINNEEELKGFCREFFSASAYQIISYQHELVWQLLSGSAVIVVEGIEGAVSIDLKTSEHRSIVEPSTQTVVRGPKDGFVESIMVNVSLIRRRIKNPHLQFEAFQIGKDTRTTVYVAYIDNIVNLGIRNEVIKRIKSIEANAIFESGNIEEFIADKTWTPFPLAYNTERPDSIAGHLLEGKVAILVDGSPFVLSVPVTIVDFFEISEDYYEPFMMGSFVRFIRYLSFLIALVTPAFYVAVITYHHELIPTQLLLGIIAQREGVPFPALVEVLLMEITFEILREAGVRMPRAVGQTVSIVGALVIGQAAVEAGIVSASMVIVVAVTAIANFVSPVYSFASASRLLRFIMILLSAGFGLYGVLIGLVAMVAHLSSLRSFGVPYLAPVAPFVWEDQNDVFIRFPIWGMKKRPRYLDTQAPIKQPGSKSPTPPPEGDGS